MYTQSALQIDSLSILQHYCLPTHSLPALTYKYIPPRALICPYIPTSLPIYTHTRLPHLPGCSCKRTCAWMPVGPLDPIMGLFRKWKALRFVWGCKADLSACLAPWCGVSRIHIHRRGEVGWPNLGSCASPSHIPLLPSSKALHTYYYIPIHLHVYPPTYLPTYLPRYYLHDFNLCPILYIQAAVKVPAYNTLYAWGGSHLTRNFVEDSPGLRVVGESLNGWVKLPTIRQSNGNAWSAWFRFLKSFFSL